MIDESALTKLYGDGVHDDTAAIQERLDTRECCIYLPPPRVCYLISRTLVMHSHQELRLDRYSTIRLAPNSNCNMLTNDDHENGNSMITVNGGIWDFVNTDQYPNPGQHYRMKVPPTAPCPENYSGIPLEFCNVDRFCARGIIVRNPTYFALTLHKVTNFVVDDIEFDFVTCNPCWGNMDGVHLNGSCRYGRITNLRGTCYDDLLALNACEGKFPGDITDIDVDGIYCDYCHSAVRLLTYGEMVRNVTIRNIHGNFYRYMVGLTHFLNERPGPAHFDNITIEDCYCGKAKMPSECPENIIPELYYDMYDLPLVLLESFSEYGTIRLANLHRLESVSDVPFICYNDMADRPSIIQPHIRNLTIENCTMTNQLGKPLEFFHCNGKIDHLVMRNNRMYPVNGECIEFAGNGVVGERE